MSEASDGFENLIRNAAKNLPKDVVSFSSHPDDDVEVAKIIERIQEAGGGGRDLETYTFGIVIKVDDYRLSEKMRRRLNTTVLREQSVFWLATNGFSFRFGWNNQKPFRTDVDVKDFPDGFARNDCIRVESKGAIITRIQRVGIEDVKASLGIGRKE